MLRFNLSVPVSWASLQGSGRTYPWRRFRTTPIAHCLLGGGSGHSTEDQTRMGVEVTGDEVPSDSFVVPCEHLQLSNKITERTEVG